MESCKTTTTVTKYRMTLTTEERDWLRWLMQNPIGCDYPDDEELYNRNMRKVFWNALE